MYPARGAAPAPAAVSRPRRSRPHPVSLPFVRPFSTAAKVAPIPVKRHIPQRSCIACGRKAPKADLLRVVRTPEGAVRADPAGRSNGRGAYLCRQAICWEKGVARRALERSLRGPVSGGDLDALQNYLIETIASGRATAGTPTAGKAALDARR